MKAIAAGFLSVVVLGFAARQEASAQWRMTGPPRHALALLQQAAKDRARCQPDPAWLPGAPKEALPCRWSQGQEQGGADFVVWGDSHARSLAPELSQHLLGPGGMKGGLTVGLPNCPPIHGIHVQGRRIKKGCTAYNDMVLAAIDRHRPRLVVLIGRWANVASDIRAPGDGEPPGRIIDAADGQQMALADALARTTEAIRGFGARVIVVGPVPEIEFNVPSTLVRALRGFLRLPPVAQADFDRRQRQVLAALAWLDATGTATVIYPHKALCDGRTCDVADGIRSLYADDDHLSPFGAARVVRSFEPLLALRPLPNGRQLEK